MVGSFSARRGLESGHKCAEDFLDGAIGADAAVVEPDGAFAEVLNLRGAVRDEEEGAAGAFEVEDAGAALFLELLVADGEGFVHD